MKFEFKTEWQAKEFIKALPYVLDQAVYHELNGNVVTTCELDEWQQLIASKLYSRFTAQFD